MYLQRTTSRNLTCLVVVYLVSPSAGTLPTLNSRFGNHNNLTVFIEGKLVNLKNGKMLMAYITEP